MSEFLQRLETAVEKRGLFSPRQKILVAVSGGVDSMVLLHALAALARRTRWEICVAHFNHHLRGRASDADERLVRETAATFRLKIFVGGADVRNFAAQCKISVEMAARKLRHEFLARTARQLGISTVALAHHADDQVELFFLRLLRGAGGEGLAGMKWRSPSPADKAIALVRPLLDFSKSELRAFARQSRAPFREDATNASPDFLRNRIRHDLLPLLRKSYQPGLEKTVLRLMEIVGGESEFVGATAREWIIRNRQREEAQTEAKRRKSKIENRAEPSHAGDKFAELPVAIQRRVLRQQLVAAGVAPDFELVEQLGGAAEKWVSVTSGLSVARDAAGNIQLRDLSRSQEAGFKAGELKLKLSRGVGQADFGGHKFRWQFLTQKKFRAPGKLAGMAPMPGMQREFFDADKIGSEIILRHWRPGDRFQPIGMKSAVRMQDLFVNAKIPAARRRELVLAATVAGEIFWVEGLRISETFKLNSQTRRKLGWKCD